MGCSASSGAQQVSAPAPVATATPTSASAERKSDKTAPILFISLDKLVALPQFPRLGISPAQRQALGYGAKQQITTPKVKESLVQDWRNLFLCVGDEHFPATDFLVELGDIDMDVSIVGFISHCWLRGWSGAPGFQDRPHPDDADNHKHRLTKEALEKLRIYQFIGCQDSYVWLDYCCINQDANPAAELKQLDLIIKSCDFLLTPIHDDKDGSWELSNTYSSFFVDYKAEAWQRYLTRGWCLVEMMYAANVQLKDKAASETRLAMLNGPALTHALKNGHRAHFLFGSMESRLVAIPHCLPPLQKSFFAEYNPITHGEVSSDADKAKIVELVKQLQPYIDAHNAHVGYIGDIDANGVRNGLGTCVYENGNVYVGHWKDDVMDGAGKHVYSDGNVYEGEYKDNVKHGLGKYSFSTGAVYEGEWMYDRMQGRGKYVHPDGETYEGEYENSIRHGQGKILYANGCAYEGEFKHGAKDGVGRYTFADGAVYDGQWKDGTYCGHGKYTHASGAVYEGEFKHSSYNGLGRLVAADGNVYEGEFCEGEYVGSRTYL